MNKKFTEEDMELLDTGTHPQWELTRHLIHTGKEVGEIISTGSRKNARKIRQILKGLEENPGLSTEEVAEKLGITP